MKVLTALTYYYPHWTGLTAFAQRIAEGLAARGHEITIVTARYRPDLKEHDEHNGVRIERVPVWFRLSRGYVMPTFIPTVARLARENDVVQTHTPMLETWAVGVAAHMAKRKMLMTHHGDLIMPAGVGNQVVQHVVGGLLNRGAVVADAISIYSQDYLDHSAFLQPHRHKVTPVYPPVVFPEPDLAAAAAWRRELGLDHQPVVSFAGRFVEEKGFDYLLQAIPLVLQQMPDVRFIFAGESHVVYESFYQRCLPLLQAAGDRVVTLGLIGDPQRLAQFYAMSDVFVLPSRSDAFASVQVEAMLCGTPVVATDIPGAREVVRATGMGRLVAPRNPEALAEGLLDVLAQRERYVRSRQEIASVFDVERAISDYERLLASLIS